MHQDGPYSGAGKDGLSDPLLEAISDAAVYTLGPDGRVLTWSRRSERLHGYSSSEMAGQPALSLFLPEDQAERPARLLREAAAQGRSEDHGWRVRKDGSQFWAHEVVTASRDATGTLLGFASFTRDLTELRRVEDEFRRRERRWRLMVESVRDYAIFMVDVNGRVQTWNTGAERTKGYSASEIIGESISRFYPPEDAAAGKPGRLLKAALEFGRVEDEGWRVRKDGTQFWADVILTAVRDETGELQGYVKVTRDLSSRRATAQALLESEQRFRLLVEAVRDYAIFMLDPKGNVTTWNSGAERIKGYRPQEILGRHFSVFYPKEEVRAGKCERELRVALQEGRFEEEGIRVRKDGSQFLAHVVLTPLWGPGHELLGFGKVTRDLTERRRAEEERLQLAQAHEAVRLRDEFLSIASHELKTPLTALQLQIQSLRARAAVDPKYAPGLTRAEKSAKRLADLVETLLDVGRIASGRLSLHREVTDLSALARGAVESFREVAERSGCELSLHTEGPVPGNWDPLRVEQVLSNLLSNAVKYGTGQPVTVHVRSESGFALVDVDDGGPGIPVPDLERIFQRFERAVSIRHFGGLGLGLYVARDIVEAHGGTILAENRPGGGARISLRLPTGSVEAQPMLR